MKNVKGKILGRKVLSFILTATLVLGLMPGNMMTVSAEGTDTVISDELIVESVSSNDVSATTECTCETDDPAFHATNCPAYIAPENPQCFCAEKCTDDTLNIWCDVCGVQGVSACQGEDTAVTYDAATPDFSAAKVLTAVEGVLCIDGVALAIDGSESTMPAGNYKLTGDITTDIYVLIGDDSTINLDLNGYTWNMSEGTLNLYSNAALSLYDTSVDGDGKITSSFVRTIWLRRAGATFNLFSGIVENTSDDANVNVVLSSYGIINLYGGTIKSNAYAVHYYLNGDITINIDDTVLECGNGHAQISASLTSNGEPCAVIDVSDYTGGALTVDAEINKAGKIKIFTGIQSEQDAENYKVNVSCDDHYDFFKEKEEYEEDGGNKYVYVSVPSFTTQPTEENDYTVAFNHPDATLQWCEKTVFDSATYTEEDEDHPVVYEVNAGDALIVSLSECLDGFSVSFDCSYNEESLYMSLDSSSKTASVTFGSEGTVDVYCMPAPYGTGEYKIEHVRCTELEGENGVQLSKTECETTYVCKATVGETVYYSDEVTIEQEHSYTCTATSDNVITKECANCGKSGTLTITAEGGVYDGTTAYGATVIKTGILENEEVIVYYYQGDTLIGTDAPVAEGKYTAKITYEGVTASVTFMISTTPTAEMFTYIESAVYDGTEKSANVVVKDGITGIGAITNIKYCQNGTEVTPINAGTYTVKIDVAEGDNYNAATDIEVGTFEITKATPTRDMFTATPSSELVYDGTEKSIIVTTDKEGMGTFTVSYDGSNYSTQLVEAAWYIVDLHIEEGDNYNAVDTLSLGVFEIKKANSAISAAPTPIAELVYDGTAHNLINEGTATGGEMQYSLDGTNYSSAIPTGTVAKTYTVWYKVVGDKNHNDTTPASIEVTIAPKTLEIDCVTARDRAFDGTNTVEISEVIIEGILVEDEDKVSVSATATIGSINAGEYIIVDLSNITLTGSAASNYSIATSVKDVPLTASVTISKAAAPTLPSGSKEYMYHQRFEGESVSITGLPTDCGEVEYVLLGVSGDMLENISVDRSSGKITYDVKALDSYTEDLQGTIAVNVEMENYDTAFYALDITRRDKYAVTVKEGMSVSLETNELIYGQRLGELAFNEVTFVGEAGEVVDGTLKWEDSNEVPDMATEKASWRFIPDNDVYKEVVGTLDITVKQAPLVVEAVPVVADRVYNPSVTLADVALSGGTVKDAYGDTIEGTWSWEDSDTVPTVVNDGYEAVFTPVDVNYETVTTTIMVTVAKATPDIGTVSVLDAELENTTDISTVVLKRTDESMAGTLELTAEALLYGAHGYVWKFTPQDLNNYEVLTGTVAIEVKDTIAPVASYKIGTGDWESFGTSTTYETFSKEELSAEIKAEDSGSGIASVQYYMAFGVIPDVSDIPGWTDYTEAITLDIDRTYVIYVKVTDNGGNEVILNSEGIVVYAESVITPTSFSCEYGEENALYVNITTNGNTFANLTDGSGNEIATENYSIDGNELTIKGEYLSDLDVGEYTYKICMNPQGVENTEVTLAYSFVVKVTAKELTVTGATATSRAYIANDKTVNITGVTLSGIQGTDDDVSVEITGLKGTLSSANAGTYTSLTLPELTLTGADKGNYELVQPTGPVTVLVGIEKLNAEIIVEDLSHGKIFGQPPFSLGVSDNNPEAEVTYESDNEDVATVTSEGIVTIHKAGSAQITVSLAESTNYISAESKQIIVDVAKEDGYTVDTIQRNYLYSRENADTIDLSAYLPADCGEVTYGTPVVMEGQIFSVAPTMNGSVLGYSVAVGEVSDAAQITVTVKSDNYADFTITVVPELVDQLPVSPKTEVTLTNDTITYGDALSEMSFEEVVFEDEAGNAVEGTLAWKEPLATPNAGTTSATWVFTPNNAEYASAEGTVAITVNKATPNVTGVPTVADRVYNPSVVLADSDLTGGTVKGVDGNSLAGSWSWQSTNVVPVVNNSGYIAVFTPTDSTNYETVTRTITVNVTKATPYVATKPTASALTYGQTLNQSVLSNGVIHYSETDSTVVAGSFAWEAGTVKPAVSDSATTLYNVLFTPDDSDNYKEVTVKLTVSVSKAEATALNNANKTYVYAESKKGESVSIEGLPEDCGSVSYEISSISDTNNMLENVSVDATGKLTYDVKSLNAYSNGLSATVTVTVSMQNYEDLTYTLTVVRTDKLVQNISAENISLTFGDNDTDIVVTGNKTELSYRVVDDSNENGDVVTVDSTGKVHIVNSGTATVEIKAEGSSSYAEAICEIQVTVAKRTVNVPAKDDTVYTYTGLPQTYSIASSPFYTIENTTQTNAGTYDVAVSLISDNYQWSAVLPEYKFVIKPAQVTITAESHTVKQGEELPTFTYTTTGLVNGEALPITVSAACIVSDTDTVGTYDIILSGPASEGNYAYSYQKGVLEVLADDEAPFIMGDDKMGWDVVSDVIDNAGKGDTVIVDMNGSTVVPGDIIEDARDKDITISFVLDNGLTWTIDGSTVTDGDIDNINFNTTVEDESNPLNNIPVDVINNVTGEKATIEVNLTYSGTLGFTAVLTANLESDNAGYYANLYYYNPITGQLEYMCADMIASNGEVQLTFTHASDYLVVIDDEDLGKKVPDGDTDDDDEDDDADTTEDKDDGKDEVPDTGDAGTFYLWVIMLCAILGMAGVTCYERVAWKRNEKE